MEFDAAQALLDLHNNIREAGTCNPRIESQMDQTEDVVKTANLYMSCFFTSNVRVEPSSRFSETNTSCYANQSNNINKIPPGYKTNTSLAADDSSDINNHKNMAENSTANNTTGEVKNNNSDCKLMRSLERMLSKHLTEQFEVPQITNNASDIKVSSKPDSNKSNIRTRDIGTQTIENNQLHKIKVMEFTIQHLSDRIKALEAQINTTKYTSHILKEENQDVHKDNEEHRTFDRTPHHMHCNKYDIKMKTSTANKSLTRDVFPCKDEEWRKENTSCKVINNVEPNDLVPIGTGRALVSARLLRHINWNSYTSATRKLLTAIFSRRVLATHSLTGKRSPAFPKKQPKKKLDVDLVQDIVQTVVDRCAVPENVVRTSITTKCADESKMYRTRMSNRKYKHRKIRENISSETTDSDDSHN